MENVRYILKNRKHEIFSINNTIQLIFEDEFGKNFYWLSLNSIIKENFYDVKHVKKIFSKCLEDKDIEGNKKIIMFPNDEDLMINQYLKE